MSAATVPQRLISPLPTCTTETIEALQQLVQPLRHVEAKARQHDWLAGYQVVISQVIRTYGDATLGQVLPAVTELPFRR